MNTILKLTIPDEKNLYFIGDIHGNHQLYERTLYEFGITKDDVIISVGDLIDRGNRIAKTLFEFLFQDNRYAILGNHEMMCLLAENRRDWHQCWVSNGGDKFISEVGETGIKFFRQYMKDLPLLIEVTHRGKTFGVVHASVPLKYNTWDELVQAVQSGTDEVMEEIHWDRDTFDYCRKNNVPNAPRLQGIDYVFSGHTGVHEPLIYGNRVWIDTMFCAGDLTISYMDGNIMRHLRKDKDQYSFRR